jgi:ribosomal-protein-alanine N-acetyltransferase
VTAPAGAAPEQDIPADLLPAAAANAPALAALHARCFPPAEAWGQDAIALMLARPGGFGAWRPGAGLVLARAAAGEAEILTLAVLPEARRRGTGRDLMRAAMAGARARGAAVMFLEVAAGNAAAVGLYRALGFAGVGRRARYYADGADALVLRRDL